MTKKQRIAAIILAVVCVLAIAFYVFFRIMSGYIMDIVLGKKQAPKMFESLVGITDISELPDDMWLYKPFVSEALKNIKKQVELDPGEVEGANDRIMLFPHVERASISKIEVSNKHGGYTFKKMEGKSVFYIDGSEETLFDAELLSTLITDCGFTLSKVKVANDDPDNLAEFGLDEASEPAYYVLHTVEGQSYKVWVGDKTPNNNGYYVRYNERNTVYVLESTLETTVLSPIESFVTPLIITPTSLTNYAMLDDFALIRGYYAGSSDKDETEGGDAQGEETKGEENKGEGGEATPETTPETTPEATPEGTPEAKPEDTSETTPEAKPEEGGENDELSEEDREFLEKLIIRFHAYSDKEKEQYDAQNKIFRLDYPGNGFYEPSGYAQGVAQLFIAYEGSETVKLDPTDEQLVEYGLGEKSAFTMFLINNPQVENEKGVKENVPTPNIVYFSDVVTDEETGEEYRYAFAPLFNIVVKMPTYNCRFLEYDLNTWISNNIFMQNIGKFASVSVKSEGVDISFKLEGEGTALVVTDNNGHKPEVKNFRLFYQVLLGMLKEGPVSLTEEQVKALVADESNVTATLTLKTHKGEKLEYKFYSFGIKSYYTINGEGEFMLPTSQVEKMVNDAVRVTRDEVVYPDNAV